LPLKFLYPGFKPACKLLLGASDIRHHLRPEDVRQVTESDERVGMGPRRGQRKDAHPGNQCDGSQNKNADNNFVFQD
jgi:hypothetical protein